MYTKRAGRHRKLSRLSRGGGVDSPELFPDDVDLPFVAGDALADAGEELAQFGGLDGELVQALVGSDRALVDVSVLIVVQIQVLPTGTRITRNGIEAPSVTGFRCRFALAVIKKRPDEDADGNRPVERETYDCLAHGQAPYEKRGRPAIRSGFNSHGHSSQEQTNANGQHSDGPRQSACAGGNGRSHQCALGNTRKDVGKS